MVNGIFAGRTTIDSIAYPERPPGVNEKVPGVANGMILPGGAAHNAAAAFAALGGDTTLVTKVGSSLESSIVDFDLRCLGISLIDCMKDQNFRLPISNIMVFETGERQIITSPHQIHTDIRFAEEEIEDALSKADICMFDTRYPSITLWLAEQARKHSVTTVLDGGNWQDRLEQLIPFIDIVICSDDFMPPGTKTHEDVRDYLKQKGVKEVAVTRGGESILYFNDKQSFEISVPKVDAVDTMGAGDIFHGSFCYYYVENKGNMKDALEKSSKIASFSCLYHGTRSWIHHLHDM